MFEPHTFGAIECVKQYQTAFGNVDTVWTYHPPKQGELTHAQLSLTEIIAEARKSHKDVRSLTLKMSMKFIPILRRTMSSSFSHRAILMA